MLLVQIDICHMCKTYTLEFKDSVQRNVEYFNHFLCYLHAEIINSLDMELNQKYFYISFIYFLLSFLNVATRIINITCVTWWH